MMPLSQPALAEFALQVVFCSHSNELVLSNLPHFPVQALLKLMVHTVEQLLKLSVGVRRFRVIQPFQGLNLISVASLSLDYITLGTPWLHIHNFVTVLFKIK